MVLHNPPHLEGVGLSTGNRYLPIGPKQNVTSSRGSYPSTTSFTDHLNLVAPGSGANLIVLARTGVPINANDETTVEVDEVKAACRG
jgi:hypothetical protein